MIRLKKWNVIICLVSFRELVPQKFLEIRENAVLEKHEVKNSDRTVRGGPNWIRYIDNSADNKKK